MIFTSQTAVQAASAALTGSEVNPTPNPQGLLAEGWGRVPVFVVGKATALAGEEP